MKYKYEFPEWDRINKIMKDITALIYPWECDSYTRHNSDGVTMYFSFLPMKYMKHHKKYIIHNIDCFKESSFSLKHYFKTNKVTDDEFVNFVIENVMHSMDVLTTGIFTSNKFDITKFLINEHHRFKNQQLITEALPTIGKYLVNARARKALNINGICEGCYSGDDKGIDKINRDFGNQAIVSIQYPKNTSDPDHNNWIKVKNPFRVLKYSRSK